MVNFEKYKIFYLVATTLNISKAAEILFISQPAVSKSIKDMERIINCKLFIRNNKGLILTSEGEILYNHVKNAYDILKNGELLIDKIVNKEEGIVKVGISNSLCRYYLIPKIKNYHKKYPKIKLRIINKGSNESMKLLSNGEVDFVISSNIPKDAKFNIKKLMDIHDIFVVNKSNKIDKKIAMDELINFSLIMLERGNETREYIENFFLENKINIQPEIEIGSMDFLVEFAKIGLGVATVIKEFVLDDLSKKKIFELNVFPKIPNRVVNLIYLKNISLSNASKSFIDSLFDDSYDELI